MKVQKTALVLAFILIVIGTAFAADYECVFENKGQVNCNTVNSGDTYCYLAGPGPIANNPAKAVSCTNNSPAGPGEIKCRLSNYSGLASALRCSNTPYYVSGPTLVGGAQGGTSCSFNDCELNQIACASAYAYMQCIPDSQIPGCNKWESKNCVANAPCYSSTPVELAKCVGVEENRISSGNGVYFIEEAQGEASSSPNQGNAISSGAGTSLEPALQYFGFAGDAKINVLDEGTDPATHYGVTIQGNSVANIVPSDLESPNFSVVVTSQASNAIKSSQDPITEARNQVKSGGITITAHGFWETVKLFFLRIALIFS